MQSYNWNAFTKRVPIRAAIGAIYDAWTTEEGIESWFLRKAIFTGKNGEQRKETERIQSGDSYTWLWHGYDDTVVEKRQILDTNGTDLLRFSFSGGCIVTVRIRPEQGENICELTQDMGPAREDEKQFFYIECGKGWTFYLTNLKSVLEHGVDLRNRNVELQQVVNA